MRDRGVDGEAVHPGIERALAAELQEPAVDAHEDLLRDLLGVLRPGDARHHRVHPALEPVVEGLHGAAVALAARLDQHGVLLARGTGLARPVTLHDGQIGDGYGSGWAHVEVGPGDGEVCHGSRPRGLAPLVYLGPPWGQSGCFPAVL